MRLYQWFLSNFFKIKIYEYISNLSNALRRKTASIPCFSRDTSSRKRNSCNDISHSRARKSYYIIGLFKSVIELNFHLIECSIKFDQIASKEVRFKPNFSETLSTSNLIRINFELQEKRSPL